MIIISTITHDQQYITNGSTYTIRGPATDHIHSTDVSSNDFICKVKVKVQILSYLKRNPVSAAIFRAVSAAIFIAVETLPLDQSSKEE